MATKTRAGTYEPIPEGYEAFFPEPLPPQPGLEWDQDLIQLLAEARDHLGQLDGMTRTLPDPDLFVLMYMRHEAVRSSRIEATQSTLRQVLLFEELERQNSEQERDTQEVVNYVKALRFGVQRLSELPLSLRLIREVHEQLLNGVRGRYERPGRFRQVPRKIGESLNPDNAIFVPPPPDAMREALSAFEQFLHDDQPDLDPLVKCGLTHGQFETIHPFRDGNGRMGRLLIVLQLLDEGIIEQPVLYISHYINRFKTEYYERLQNIRDQGDWEGWIRFFLEAVRETAKAAAETTRSILRLRERDRQTIGEQVESRYRFDLHDYLFEMPIVTSTEVKQALDCSYGTANRLVQTFEEIGVLQEFTGKERYREYVYRAYYNKFEELDVDES